MSIGYVFCVVATVALALSLAGVSGFAKQPAPSVVASSEGAGASALR